MRAVDIGVGHDDDLVVAQVVDVETRAHVDAKRLAQVVDLLVGTHLGRCRAQHVQDLAAQGQQGLLGAVAGHLGGTAGAVALDDEQFGPVAVGGAAIDQLAGQAQLFRGRLARGLLFLAATQTLLGAQHQEIQDRARGFGVRRQPGVEMVAHRALDQARSLGRGQAVLGLAHEFRFTDEAADQRATADDQILTRDLGGFLVADAFAIAADALQDRSPEAHLVGAALGGGDGVAIGLDEAVARGRPVDRPVHLARNAELGVEVDAAGKRAVGIGAGPGQGLGQVIGQAAGEMERGLARGLSVVDLGLPADLDAAEQVGLGFHHLHQPRGLEAVMAKDLLVGMEGHGGAAPVRGRPDLGDRPLRDAAGKALLEQLLVARDLHNHQVRQRVHDRRTHTVQTTRGLIGVARELAPRMQRAQDHLQRGLAGELGVRIDGNAAAVVAHDDAEIGQQLDLDARGVACHGLVHRVVQDFRDQVMQRAFVGAADIHAGTLAHRLQPLQHLDRGCGIGVAGGVAGEKVVGHGVAH